jgi:FkbH-like protein
MDQLTTALYWLPKDETWRARLKAFRARSEPSAEAWDEAVALANLRLEFTGINALDQAVQALFKGRLPPGVGTKPVRLAILGSSTTSHLHAGIRAAGLRRGMWISTYEPDYGQYFQELADKESGLHAFKPTAVLFVLDAQAIALGVTSGMNDAVAEGALAEVTGRVKEAWRLAREAFACPIIHQTGLDVFPGIVGENEDRLGGARGAFMARYNEWLKREAPGAGVDLLSIDRHVLRQGLFAWFNPALWHRSKQEISLPASPLYGDLVGRVLAAKQGRSFKCLVLDLDNTLWGGVIGDDGLEGIALGQGSALGEAFVSVQDYAREQARRGIILAVCSKNDEANAIEPFEKHPDMVLKKSEIACFVANWQDKAGNLRAIAQRLNIGIDSLVFLDDNPFERALVRQELPMVAVPEVGDDPALYPYTLADAGYFESVAITDEDRARGAQYQGNLAREALRDAVTDMDSYLRGLEMQMIWRPFDAVGLSRTVQLINKTNQFNLTTKRYTEDDVKAIMDDERAVGLQLRLTDRFGDNGIIGIVIGKLGEDGVLEVDTWLMSCRVLGRQVEQATLNLLAAKAKELGARAVRGVYVPTKKNGMVKNHYEKLGFTVVETDEAGGSVAVLDFGGFVPPDIFIDIVEG